MRIPAFLISAVLAVPGGNLPTGAIALLGRCALAVALAAAIATTGAYGSGVTLKSAITAPTVPAQPSPIAIAPSATPPDIDGDLADECWSTATHAEGFYRYGGTQTVVEQTEAWICSDRDHLYVAFHCLDHHPELIRSSETIRNGDIGADDYVSVDIDSQNTRRDVSEFSVSARGTQADYIEGGTADNITWEGDWKAATRRLADGWTAEFEIPFALLRYPKGTHAMGILLKRKLSRENASEGWPYMTRDEQQHSIQYLTTFTFDGVKPADYHPRPIFLPYALITGGDGYNGREGIDIKYPFTTSITGLATVNPDFRDVAQQVTDINFSYNQKYYGDSRPFFAEGAGYMPYSDVFYSRAIGDIDEGVKVTGRQGPTTIAALATNSHLAGGRSDEVASVFQSFGPLSDVHLSMAQDQQAGIPSSLVAKMEGTFGWLAGKTRYSLTANHVPSYVNGRASDAGDYVSLSSSPLGGKPYFSVDVTDIGPAFRNNIGYVPEIDTRGSSWGVGQSNSFDGGKIDYYSLNLGGSYYNHHTGGFFNKSNHLYGYLSFRSGTSLSVSMSRSQRNQFRDHVDSLGMNWGGRTLYGQGGISYAYGTQADQHYGYLSVYQGYPLSRSVSMTASVNRLTFGSTVTTQGVVAGTYRLTSERSIGLRCVGLDHDVNTFLSFAQRVRAGQDIYILVGDPNSTRTRGLVTLKVVSPF